MVFTKPVGCWGLVCKTPSVTYPGGIPNGRQAKNPQATRQFRMGEILLHYERVNPTSWAYLSSLLIIAIFFKFNRVFCMRNLDLLFLILLGPGLLCIEHAVRGQASELTERFGYIWLFFRQRLALVTDAAGFVYGKAAHARA